MASEAGWVLRIKRLGLQQDLSRKRTYGSYAVEHGGKPVDGLSGFICECPGPGDNQHAGSGKCIEKGSYPLWTQFGRYRTIGYSIDTKTPGAAPMPGLRLEGTKKRVGILIHPGHPPSLYLSSIGCLNPTGPLTPDQTMDFWNSRSRVIALINNLRAFAPGAFEHEVMTRIPDALVVIEEPAGRPAIAPAAALAMAPQAAAALAEPASLPISKLAAVTCATWLRDNFGDAMRSAVRGKPYKVEHLCGIVCQESAYKWLKWIAAHDPATILARCVFDASGDYPGTSRSAFPKDTTAFRARYGDAFTDMLIDEANLTRRLQGMGDKPWVYKGYGIFQYDLQKVVGDRAFFEKKQWSNFGQCLTRVCSELDAKLAQSKGDLWDAIRRYNGSGAAAQHYTENVRAFTAYCRPVVGG